MKNKNKKNRHASAIYRKGKKIYINKGLIILVSLLIGICFIGYESTRLLNDLGAINFDLTTLTTKKTEKHLSINPVANKDVFRPKTEYKENETEVYLASKAACKHHGLDNDWCVNDLMGIAYAEHRDFSKIVGDSGKSLGVFQINTKYHKEITAEQANDTYWAANWTLRRMIYNGYKTNRDKAIRNHNGSHFNPRTKKYLETVNYYISIDK